MEAGRPFIQYSNNYCFMVIVPLCTLHDDLVPKVIL